MKRGEIWWANLPPAAGSGPGYRRPVLIVQSNAFNESRISTVLVAVITSNTALGEAPGNVRLTLSYNASYGRRQRRTLLRANTDGAAQRRGHHDAGPQRRSRGGPHRAIAPHRPLPARR